MISKSIVNKLLVYCNTRESQNLLKELVLVSCIEPQFILDMIEEFQSLGSKGIEGKYVKAVLDFICDYSGISYEEIMSHSRKRTITDSRKMAIFFIYHGTRLNKTAVARFFNKDHATILHSLKGHAILMEVDSSYRNMYDIIQGKLSFANYNTQNDGNENSISSGTDGLDSGRSQGIEETNQFSGGTEEGE
ncbi:Chromosomal replication initiator, DnaA C-terminal [uncultured Caudovirales phage]|uniref:Chromosomal replication initiator, DnaA C-terminal n=1 Tax=uncultured Caudovirales phage TaxID=2100421 RepID=A0A6J7X0R8_9CAUD|nr:Chromosomal replication initiator, DnaA C-terminal [uncultured Caudovirales phage]